MPTTEHPFRAEAVAALLRDDRPHVVNEGVGPDGIMVARFADWTIEATMVLTDRELGALETIEAFAHTDLRPHRVSPTRQRARLRRLLSATKYERACFDRIARARALAGKTRPFEPLGSLCAWLHDHDGLTVAEIVDLLGATGLELATRPLDAARRKVQARIDRCRKRDAAMLH